MRCATAVILLVAILQQVTYVHANIPTISNDELEQTWHKRLGGAGAAEATSAATHAAEAGAKVAKASHHVSRTVAGAITAAAATLGFGGGIAAHKYHSDRKQAQKLSLRNEPPMKRDSLDDDFEVRFNKRGKPIPVKKVIAIATGAAAGGAGVGALGHSLYEKDKARRKGIAAVSASESGSPMMKKRTFSELDNLPFERRGKPFTGPQVAAIAGGSIAAGLATGIGVHAMVQDHNTVRKVRNGELPMKRFEKEENANILLKRSPGHSVISPRAAGIIGAASFASGAAIGGLGHKAYSTPNRSMPMSMSQGPPQGPGPIERGFEDGERLVRRANLKAFQQGAKKFLETKHGPHVAGGALALGVTGAAFAGGHALGHHSERNRIDRFQAEQQQGGGGEGAMMMVKRAGINEAFKHAGASLKGGMTALHGKVGKNGLIAGGTAAGAVALAGVSYATGRHQGKISNIDDHKSMSMGPSAGGGGSSMMYKRGILVNHPKAATALTLGATGLIAAGIGSTSGKLHEQRKLNGMNHHLPSSSASMKSSAGATAMGLSEGGAEGRMMKRGEHDKAARVLPPTSSEVEEAVKKGKPRRSRVKEVYSPSSHLTPTGSTATSNSGGSVSQHASGASSSHSSGSKVLEHQHSTASSKGLSGVAHQAEHASSGSAAVKAGEKAAASSLKNFHVTGKQATIAGGVLAVAGGAGLVAHHLTKSNNHKMNGVSAGTVMRKRSESVGDELLQKRSPGQLNKALLVVGTGALAGGSYLAGYATGKPAGVSKAAQHEMKMRNSGGGMGGGMYKRAIAEAEVEFAKREAINGKTAQKAVMGVGAAGLMIGGYLAGRNHGMERGQADYHTQKLSRGGGGGYYKRSIDEVQMVKRGPPMRIHKKILLAAGVATAGIGLTVPAYKFGKKDGKHSARMARQSSMQGMSAPMDNSPAPMEKRETHKKTYELGKPQQYGKGNKLPLRSEVDDKMLY
ncbi:uncharacterized protein FA14DRAFT_87783 [Meira miltonrushii]|uniref:DUF3824 domain-containing protein n=1 Tax=Meira miltonrushii TaxID=1280837 RepID=A0A316V4B6_9BASI|nr:uncharacterized protein FA14DRAFT_87783 [Meira miltonrushii]PWN32386.1 hypothetical protein FA14DRAFT_87783 [Meira miltonrushii]